VVGAVVVMRLVVLVVVERVGVLVVMRRRMMRIAIAMSLNLKAIADKQPGNGTMAVRGDSSGSDGSAAGSKDVSM
jgi:multisubunit Na+/H+ antiporter MnhC subunit